MTDKRMTASKQGSLKDMPQAAPLRRFTPAVDIYETSDDLVMIADMPGAEEKDLQLEVSRGVLTLEAAIGSSGEEPQRSYYRQFRLSERINADAGEATLKDGVLSLRLPKAEEAKPKKITVKTLH